MGEQGKGTDLFLWWLGGRAELRTGLDSSELPSRAKGKSNWAFFSIYIDMGQKRKGDQWDLKAVSSQTSKIESDYYSFITYVVIRTASIRYTTMSSKRQKYLWRNVSFTNSS